MQYACYLMYKYLRTVSIKTQLNNYLIQLKTKINDILFNLFQFCNMWNFIP